MDYLNSIHCKKEPFVDTPGADFFQSKRFRESLEKLTHSIRLGAGLHIVLGENGTGKSTLIKFLQDKFGADQNIEIIHIQNPQFDTVEKFYATLASIFKGYKPASETSDKKQQEEFNTFLHKHCLAKKKSILLLIDEGQAIPDFCLQALDNFYEFHPDCRRFLQTVICGQPPLQKKTKSIKNLHSRAAFTVSLKKFSFKETKEMISFHLEQAALDGQPPPSLFSRPAQWAIYRLSQGAPGDILDLCHLAALTLVIENRQKVDWFMALRCANLLVPGRAKKLQAIRVGTLSTMVVAMLAVGLWSKEIKTFIEPPAKQIRKSTIARQTPAPKPKPAEKIQVIAEDAGKKTIEIAKPATPAIEEQVAAVTPQEEAAPSPEKITVQQPEQEITMVEIEKEPPLGEILPGQEQAPPASITFVAPEIPSVEDTIVTAEPVETVETITPKIQERREVQSGDTFLVMIQQVYGEGHLKPHYINQVIEANPQLVNPHNLLIGDEVFFPKLTQEPEIPKPVMKVAAKGKSLVSKKLDRKLAPAGSPDLIGSLTVMPGDTLGKLIRGIYGPFSFNPEYTRKVLAVNPQLNNPDSLVVGETVFFPDLPVVPEIGLPATPKAVASRGELPEFLGEIITIEEETFSDMIRQLYGPYSFTQENLNKVLAVNPQTDNPDVISVGQKIRFPTILISLTDRAPEVWWVKLVTLSDLQNAYRFLRVYSKWAPPMLIIPSRNEAGVIRYNIMLQEYYVDQVTAEAKIKNLPASVTAEAKPIHGLDSKTYYYWTEQGK
jgi:type II secretory pathway predicted ATPase ExeA/nucleoid-associated protein YgaU